MERRLDPHKLILAAASLAWLIAAPAQAQSSSQVEELLPRFGLEVRISPFRPVLSDNTQVEAVRNEVFQDRNWFAAHPMRYALEFDYYPVTAVGLFGVYGRVGFWRQTANSRVCRGADGNTVVQCTSSTILSSEEGADETAINVVPFSAGAIYRYDMLRRNAGIPLLLSAKAGFEYFLWWSTLGDSASRQGGPDGPLARGGTVGLSAAVQVAFPLDAFKTPAPMYGTREAKQSNYIFLEYSLGYAPGLFQSQPRFDMSDLAIVTLGLSIDMT